MGYKQALIAVKKDEWLMYLTATSWDTWPLYHSVILGECTLFGHAPLHFVASTLFHCYVDTCPSHGLVFVRYMTKSLTRHPQIMYMPTSDIVSSLAPQICAPSPPPPYQCLYRPHGQPRTVTRCRVDAS